MIKEENWMDLPDESICVHLLGAKDFYTKKWTYFNFCPLCGKHLEPPEKQRTDCKIGGCED